MGIIRILASTFTQCDIDLKHDIAYALLSHIYYSSDELTFASIEHGSLEVFCLAINTEDPRGYLIIGALRGIGRILSVCRRVYNSKV
jgi:hypothetical protein